MNLSFTKYHGTGNDFIMINAVQHLNFKLTDGQISKLCHRRFGIGADGLIILYPHSDCDFLMDYYNADGTKSFCGNGARCAVHFAKTLQIIGKETTFMAIDGVHHATIEKEIITLKMGKTSKVSLYGKDFMVHTGSPHYIQFANEIEQKDMLKIGREIRYSEDFRAEGINVNLVEILEDNYLKMRTYERGVEDETYSCGTGAVAVALTYLTTHKSFNSEVKLKVKGGELWVRATSTEDGFEEVYLIGAATLVYEGKIKL